MKPYIVTAMVVLITGCQSVKTDTHSSKDTAQNSQVVAPPDSLRVGELIDGPANVRDTVNGRILFSLFDEVPVESTDTTNMWVQVGLVIDVTPSQYKVLHLEKGDTIFLNKRQVGIALDNVRLQAGMQTKRGLKGELVGYTSFKNIKKNTIPEYGFERIVIEDPAPTVDRFTRYFKEMGFESSNSEHFVGFQLDENWIDDPSPMLRLWVLFNHDKLFGVVHSRKLNLNNSTTHRIDRGFTLTIIGDQEPKLVSDFIKEFNSYINQVD